MTTSLESVMGASTVCSMVESPLACSASLPGGMRGELQVLMDVSKTLIGFIK